MPEGQAGGIGAGGQYVRPFGLLEGGVDIVGRRRYLVVHSAAYEVAIAGGVRRCDQDSSASRCRKQPEALQEPGLQAAADRKRPAGGARLEGAGASGEFVDREGVARGFGDDPVPQEEVRRGVEVFGEQGAGVGVSQPGDRQFRQSCQDGG